LILQRVRHAMRGNMYHSMDEMLQRSMASLGSAG